MITAVIAAAILGVIATYGLTGRGGQATGLAAGFVATVPVIAVSGAGLQGITLLWAVGMAIAVAVGMLLAPMVLRQPRGPYAAAVMMTAGIVMAAATLRWLVPIIADMTGLNARILALACLAAAAVVAAGNRSTLVRTTLWSSVVLAVLLLVGGVALGAPATLTSPILESPQKPLAGAVWLIIVVIFAALHPAPVKSAAGGIVGAVLLLLGLVGLLSFVAGYISFPSPGLFVIAGYTSSGGGLVGLVLTIIPLIVTVIATGAVMRAAQAPWTGFTAPGRLTSPALRISIIAVLVALFTIAPVPTWVMVTAVAVAGIGALILDRRGSDATDADTQTPAEATAS